MKTNIMLDLEALHTQPGGMIVSIGAVKFTADGLGDTFYQRICMEKAQSEGFIISAATVKWWLTQAEDAQAELVKPGGISTAEALSLFNCFVNDCDPLLWGNGANFDNSILGAAYDHLSMPKPWKFCNDRCYRTVKALHPDMPLSKRTGTHHNALDDAISQAEHLITLPSFRAMAYQQGLDAHRASRFSATEPNESNVKKMEASA